MPLYAIRLHGGRIGLMMATNVRSANKRARAEQGDFNVASVTRATDEDVAHVKMMGGTVPRF